MPVAMKPIAKARFSNLSMSILHHGVAHVPIIQHEPCQVAGVPEIRHFCSKRRREIGGAPSGSGHWHG